MNRTGAPRIIFITGTDTGVGKTLLTALLLQHLRASGCHALAMKPFCSGSRADAVLLRAVQERELTLNEINPFFFSEPLAPLVAARKHHRSIRLLAVLRRIRGLASRCQCLLVEGIGGVMVPLGEGFCVGDLIAALSCEVILVSRNQLGTINHTRLSYSVMQYLGIERIRTVLMAVPTADASNVANGLMLSEMLAPTRVFSVPYLGKKAAQLDAIKAAQKKINKTLAQILG